jgi:hypothetical protein
MSAGCCEVYAPITRLDLECVSKWLHHFENARSIDLAGEDDVARWQASGGAAGLFNSDGDRANGHGRRKCGGL